MKVNYSLDMLRLEYKITRDRLQVFLDSFRFRTDCDYWESFKCFSYRHQFTFKVDLNNSYTLLADFNGCKSSDDKVVILEFNPNKVGSDLGLLSLLGKLRSISYYCRIVRFDCAIDIPVPRDRCKLIKDQRTYSEYKNSSSDYTQYLGHRNKHGYVKLYNKAKELGLEDDNLTRLEITIDGDKTGDFETMFPLVYVVDDTQLDFDIDGTDKVLLFSCIDNPGYLSLLGWRKRKKIKELIGRCSFTLSADVSLFSDVCNLCVDYMSCSASIINKFDVLVNGLDNPFCNN